MGGSSVGRMDGAWRLSDGDLLAALDAAEVESRRCYAHKLALIHEIRQRGVPAEAGSVTVQQLLKFRLRCSAGEAAQLVRAARGLLSDPGPELAATSRALQNAQVGPEQVRIIGAAMSRLPLHIDAPTRSAAEEQLAQHAVAVDATTLRKIADHLVHILDPDGSPPPDNAHQCRELTMRPDGVGGTIGNFRLDGEGAALLKAALDPLAAPRTETADGKDVRTAATRRADALVELAARALDDGALPSQGGERPHLGIIVDYEQLQAACARVTLDTGDDIGVSTLRRIACDAQVYPIVLGSAGEPLDIGRASRVVPPYLRRAVVARDRGCAFPGCAAPARWCHVHHIRHWVHGGDTSIANLVLLCGRHHRLIHHTEWTVEIATGRARFRPPPLLDPDRKPLVNSLHHVHQARPRPG